MGRKITHLLYEPVDAGHGSCTGCVFEGNDLECGKHACMPVEFPDGHPLKEATTYGVIWIKKDTE